MARSTFRPLFLQTKPRLPRILKLVIPLVIAAALGVVIYYLVAMQYQLVNRVVFDDAGRQLNMEDRRQIERLVLSLNEIMAPSHPLLRYTIKINTVRFQKNSRQLNSYSGEIIPNSPSESKGFIGLTKQSGQWEILYFATGS